MIGRFLLWLVLDGPPLGRLAPWVMGLALGRMPRKMNEKDRRIAVLEAAIHAALDFYEWHMQSTPSEVLDELVERRAALQAQLKAALEANS